MSYDLTPPACLPPPDLHSPRDLAPYLEHGGLERDDEQGDLEAPPAALKAAHVKPRRHFHAGSFGSAYSSFDDGEEEEQEAVSPCSPTAAKLAAAAAGGRGQVDGRRVVWRDSFAREGRRAMSFRRNVRLPGIQDTPTQSGSSTSGSYSSLAANRPLEAGELDAVLAPQGEEGEEGGEGGEGEGGEPDTPPPASARLAADGAASGGSPREDDSDAVEQVELHLEV